MGGAVSAGENNDDLIDNLLEADYIKSPDVERVFRAVDRAHYMTKDFQDNAYKDLAWKSGNLHISAPCIYSEVMEGLKLSSGLSFLNLGSGTGYLSTMVGLILGPYGINHGVEIHEDVIQYAQEKLDEFWSKSSAIDEYEFCTPKFVQGNCLTINTDERLYDRVYCGAACPEHHENYMKNLIKIGGVLVMPLNDQLLQIIRTSETTWDVKAMLPVSFASLMLPEETKKTAQVKLPESEPLRLQAICRSTIRVLLRASVDRDHPELGSGRRSGKRSRNKRVLRRFVVPIFEESDVEGEGTEGPDGATQMATVMDWARSLAQASQGGEGGGGGEARKRVKLDSGIGDDDSDSDSMDVDSDVSERPRSESHDPWIQQFRVFARAEDSGEESSPPEENQERECPPPDPDSYGKYMRCKIQGLPLPVQMKHYLNLCRDF